MRCCFDLLHLLADAGVVATAESGRLVLRPAARVPRELVTEIVRHRNKIVALLTGAVILGPWLPTTPEHAAGERRRVMEEEPRRWWWKPRYRLAELEREDLSRTEAMAKVRAESERDP
jgi:hypothetical protein